jgi:hypothetical protein
LSGDAKLFKQLSDARVENVLLHRAPLVSLGYPSLTRQPIKGQPPVGRPRVCFRGKGMMAEG